MSTEPPDHSNPGADFGAIPIRRVTWGETFRLIPSRFPPIHVFERVAPREDWENLYKLEGLTNPRLREEAGSISMVPAERRVTGSGATIVMAPFTHVSKDRPTRFSDGSYGVYYAARTFLTALKEVAFHMGRFYEATADPAHSEDYRTYQGSIDKLLHDIRGGGWDSLLNPEVDQYPIPQAVAKALRAAGSDGIVYPSVRDPGGECIAIFWPDVVSIPAQSKHIQYKWNGNRISAWFDYESEQWRDLVE